MSRGHRGPPMLRPTNTHEKRGSGRISPNTRQYGFHPALWSGINYFAFSTYTKTFLTKRRRAARLRLDICCQFTPFNFRMTHAYNILTLRGFRLSGREFKKEKKKGNKNSIAPLRWSFRASMPSFRATSTAIHPRNCVIIVL